MQITQSDCSDQDTLFQADEVDKSSTLKRFWSCYYHQDIDCSSNIS